MQELSIIKLHKQTLPFINISLYLNSNKPIQSLIIENLSERNTDKIEIKIYSDIPCIDTFSYLINVIPEKNNIKIPLESLNINRQFLNSISETEKAKITIEVIEKDISILKDNIEIDVHPLEYFGGFQVLPELIASYITPNHPYIYNIKRKAINVLENKGLKTSFEGYQSNDPEQILQVMSAIYTAIQNEEIVYSSLPPGYEAIGQRLRLLNTIQNERFGNCIDLSLLFAACLEAIDLNPIIIILKDHAFVGCWLLDDKFPEVVNDDKTAITKRLSKGISEIAAVEATSVCKGNNIKFRQALDLGEAQLVENENFILSIDIKRARSIRIRPLPLLNNSIETKIDEEAISLKESNEMEELNNLGTIYGEGELIGKTAKTKQKIWERNLLDLSLRNNLLNLSMTRNMLQFVDISVSDLEDTLSDGKSFSIMPSLNAQVLKKYNQYNQPLHHSSELFQFANEELKNNRLFTYYHEQDLDNILVYIHKNAKQSIEENGSSTLYLAVGLLKWYDNKTPEISRYAPILLVPVEISRRSVNSKFVLKSREEETMINITLIEFLRQEFELNLQSLEQLPFDEKGVDVAKVFGILRRGVMSLKGWDVLEQIVLGNFSFNKLILWQDIVANSIDLLKSDLVRSLTNSKLEIKENDIDQTKIDFDSLESDRLLLPIPTDISQMQAVYAAHKGQSFILHGPPGTGKSQTITNIIADSLGKGKRVLFVASKKAALDVVHKRLEQIGLSPFTLELHSNKSRKSDVLSQLEKSIETKKILGTLDFEEEAKRLDNSKNAISDYVNTLHKKQKTGWSLYESITILEDLKKENFPIFFISDSILEQLDNKLWQQWIDWLPEFQSIVRSIIHPSENPLVYFNFQKYTPSLNQEILIQTQNLLDKLFKVEEKSREISEKLFFPFPINNKKEWEIFTEVIIDIQSFPDISLELFKYLADKENYELYEKWVKEFRKYLTIQKNILENYDKSIIDINVKNLELQWKKSKQSWFLKKFLSLRKIKNELSLYRKTPFKTLSEIDQLFQFKNELEEVQSILHQVKFSNIQKIFKNLYLGDQTDIEDIENKANSIKKINDKLSTWERKALPKWIEILENKNKQYTDEITQGFKTEIKEFSESIKLLEDTKNIYEKLTGFQFNIEEDWIKETIDIFNKIIDQLPSLKNWLNYIQLRKNGLTLNLEWLIESYENKNCNKDNLTDYFTFTLHSSLSQKIIFKHESLSLFNVELFENKIKIYRKIAKEFQQLSTQELRIRLTSQLPDIEFEAIKSSEISILKRAIKNKGRGLSIRKLFDQIPTLLPRIAPCFLMSPISVAQYFDIKKQHFDILIFDEASQLPTCEAVSAIARSKQCIIVGDPKQMPPTSFFNTIKLDEENMDVEDLESILDDFLSLSLPSKYLLRHYRSKHESLIAFSNINYYDSKLVTFPSSDDLNRKVVYHNVKGFYEKGKTRTNKFEADKIIEFIKNHYKDPQKRNLSLGVVTFSQTQQNLIEEKLTKLFTSDSKLEEFVNENKEPLFIKNLENVQGDERDVILFSICYAQDENGKISMNFGPLNRDGGWRRLNVAITRARYEMHIFSTLEADQIDLRRTSSEGVANLKSFLKFAENGQLNFRPEHFEESLNKIQLSTSIGEKLKEKGFIVKCNIGTSSFKLDIGVIHPDKPKQYILGIIIDGHNYLNSNTTNDREMVLPSFLKSLNWNIHRIWTMDWIENSNKIIDDIIDKIKQLQINGANYEEEDIKNEKDETLFESININQIETSNTNNKNKQVPYSVTYLPEILNDNLEAIFEPQNKDLLKKQIQSILENESPISKNLLQKRILKSWNISRLGLKVENYLEEILNEMSLTKKNHYQTFFYHINKNLDFYRSNDLEKRNIEDISPEEIIVALDEIITLNLSIEEDELIRYLGKKFGFNKVGNNILSVFQYVIEFAINNNKIIKNKNRIFLVN
jgi:superfamily I DNA and/or RNA helicase